jgi:hypothetical protein
MEELKNVDVELKKNISSRRNRYKKLGIIKNFFMTYEEFSKEEEEGFEFRYHLVDPIKLGRKRKNVLIKEIKKYDELINKQAR